MTYTVSPVAEAAAQAAQRFNEALDRANLQAHQQFRRLMPHDLAAPTIVAPTRSSGLRHLLNAATPPIETTGVNITHYGKEWARISRDGTVTKLDIEMAREIRRGVTWDTGRVVSINDVLCMLVTDAYEMGRLAATPKRDTVRVRDL